MLPEYFAIIGAVIASLGGFYYLYCTIRGTVQPNRVTWFFWGAFPMIAFVAQRAQDVDLIAWATFAAGFTPFLIVLASLFNPKAYWKIVRLDYIFAAIAVVGIILWAITEEPNFALAFALLADLAAALPTVIKAYKFPESESWVAYGISTVGFTIALLSAHVWSFEHIGFLIYLVGMNLILALLSLRCKQARVTQEL